MQCHVTNPIEHTVVSTRQRSRRHAVGKIKLGGGIWGCALLLLALFLSPALHAQQYLGTITGAVNDNTGAKIPNAKVTVTEAATNSVTETVTNESGVFTIPFMDPGTYTVKVSANGFTSQVMNGIILEASGNKQLDFILAVGSVNESVSVSAQTQMLETGSANLGDTLAAKEVAELPNIGRNPFILSTLSAGIYTDAFAQRKASQFTQPYSGVAVQLSTNGIGGHDKITIDGIPDDPPERQSGANYTGFVPSPEAVQEVKTQTALYDAQYGHSAGTVLNTVLKTGTNQIHGSAYYVFQNTYLNANTAERARQKLNRANDQWNQPGFVLDGPVYIPKVYNGRDKTFFTVAYERIQNNSPQQNSGRVPTDAERSGDFSALQSVLGITIYDPLTYDSSNNRTAFAGNIIPASRINPVAKNLLNFIPKANATGTSSGLMNNWVADSNTTTKDHYYSFTTRIDHNIGTKDRISGTYLQARRKQEYAIQGYPNAVGSPGYIHNRDNTGGSGDWVHVFSPTLVLDSRIGVIYHPFGLQYYGHNYDLGSLGFSSTLTSSVPVPTFPGASFSDSYAGLSVGNGQFSESTIGSYSELLSKTFGAHNLRVGFEFQVLRYNLNNPTSNLGTFSFNRGFTQKNTVNGDSTSGDPVASFLLGYPSSATESTNVSNAYQQVYYAGFVQDDWRLTPKLTLNYGLRWDYESPMSERNNQQNAGFCFTCASPLQATGLNLTGGLLFTNSSHRNPYKQDFDNWQPRVGVAYQLTPKVVMRAGFGKIYFQTTDFGQTNGFSTTTSYVSSLDSKTPANSLTNPYPNGFNAPSGRSQGLATLAGSSISFTDVNHIVPHVYQTSANVQTQLPGDWILEIGYVGTFGRDIEVGKNINALPAKYFSLGTTYLQTKVANPMYGVLPSTSSLGASTIQNQYLLVPYPQFGSITENNISKGTVGYNAMQNRLTKKLGHGLTVHANFTWAKIMNKTVYVNSQDDNLTRFEDAQPNKLFSFAATYQIPTPFESNSIARQIFGGWQVNDVLRMQNGALLNNPSGAIALRSAKLAHQTYDRMFNTCYLDTSGNRKNCASSTEQPAYQQMATFALSNVSSSTTMNGVRNMVSPIMDLSMFKKITLHERYNFEIRGEFFNVFNTVNFGGPTVSLTSTANAYVNRTQANDPRIGQLTARINF